MGNLCNRSVKFEDEDSSPDSSSKDLHSSETKQLSFKDLKTCTGNFDRNFILGEGSTGVVFKGWIDGKTYSPTKPGRGIMIAIKKYKTESSRHRNEWQTELKYLSRFRHENIVRLIGHCSKHDAYLHAYEYMHEGSLANHLFKNKSQSISWPLRVNIAIDVARVVTFLHDQEKPVIYRDLKSSHILLDKDFRAKLSDFGLAIDGLAGENALISVEIAGTVGFIDPYYIRTGHLGVKTDVYGFGMILQELISGKQAWKIMKENGNNDYNVDSRLERNYNEKEAKDIFNISLQCLSDDPNDRPTMANVFNSLQEIVRVPDIIEE